MDAVAPGLLLAQGIGRIGNWWNQELYGKPTTLPWGLKIDPAHLPADPKYLAYTTFHPTFLYELIWDVIGVLLLLWIGRRFRINPPNLFALYVAWYCFGRFFEELLRIDPAHHIAGSAPERVGEHHRVRLRRRVLRLAASARPRRAPGAEAPRAAEAGAHDGDPQGPRPVAAIPSATMPVAVRELELDLDAFEGPFDLLLSLVLREELPLREIDLAEIVVTFVEHLAERGELDLDACGEFLILISALLELKARAMFPEEDAELAELEPEEAAEELARRLAEYRRAKEAAGFLRDRLDERRDLHFRLGPAPLAPVAERKLAPQAPEQLAAALALACGRAAGAVARAHGAPLPAGLAVPRPLAGAAPPAQPLRLRPGGGGALARRGRRRVPGPARAAQAERDRDRASRAVRAR